MSHREQPAQLCADRVVFDQETVMTEVGADHHWNSTVQRLRNVEGDLLLSLDGEQPVAVDADDERPGRHPGQRSGQSAATAADVVRVHRLDQRDVAVRIEAAGELVAVEVEVRLDGEAAAAAEGADAALPGALEAR